MAKAKIKSGVNSKSVSKVNSEFVSGEKGAFKPGKAFRSDARQTATLIKVGRTGAANAIRASKALGLPITYLQNGVLYKEYADGTKEIIETGTVKKNGIKEGANRLKKGMVLHAKK